MSSTPRTLLLLLLSPFLLLLLFTILYFSPLCNFSSFPFLSNSLSFFHPNHTSPNDHYLVDVFDDKGESFPHVPTRTWPPVDEKDVVILTWNNFSHFVSANQFVMVNFYAPWCHWSKKLAPEYAAAATLLKGQALLAKVDGNEEVRLEKKYKVKGYPTMLFFVGGGVQKAVYDSSGERTRDAIANWVKLKISPQVQTITSECEVRGILATKSTIGLAFIDNLEDPISKELAAVSKLHIDVDFYQTTDVDVAKLFNISPHVVRPAFFMLKREERENHTHFHFDSQFTASVISDFVSIYKLPSVITFSEEDVPFIFQNPMKQLWLFTPTFSWQVVSAFKETARAFRGKLLFVHVESGRGIGRQLSYEFCVADDTTPKVVAYMANSKKHIYCGELTLSGIKSFTEEFLEDRLLSQPDTIPNTFLKLPTHSGSFLPTDRPFTY